MKHTRFLLVIAAAVCATCYSLSAASEDGPLFMGLGDLPGDIFYSVANGVSGDGTVVVGSSVSENGWEAFRWTFETGMIGLGDLPGGYFLSLATDASYDGSAIVGQGASEIRSESRYSDVGREAFLWTEETGMVGLGDLPESPFASTAHAVSGNGLVVVGAGNETEAQNVFGSSTAFRWTAESEMLALGALPGGSSYSEAADVSADGSIVVGAAGSLTTVRAFRWTEETGMATLAGESDDGPVSSIANAVSADGEVIVGWSMTHKQHSPFTEAFRWTEEDGVVRLGDLPGGELASQARDVSEDGSVIIGRSSSDLGQEPFVWDEYHGMQALTDVLANDYGLDLTGWTLDSAQAISDDGLVIVGRGINPDGNIEGWVACLRDECFEDEHDDED